MTTKERVAAEIEVERKLNQACQLAIAAILQNANKEARIVFYPRGK